MPACPAGRKAWTQTEVSTRYMAGPLSPLPPDSLGRQLERNRSQSVRQRLELPLPNDCPEASVHCPPDCRSPEGFLSFPQQLGINFDCRLHDILISERIPYSLSDLVCILSLTLYGCQVLLVSLVAPRIGLRINPHRKPRSRDIPVCPSLCRGELRMVFPECHSF